MESVKKAFARQRAKDLAEHTNATLAKEKELENLRKKCQELSDKLSNGAQSTVQVCTFILLPSVLLLKIIKYF